MNIYIIYNYWELLLSLILIEQENNKNNLLIVVENEIDKKIIDRLEENYKIERFNFSTNRFLRFVSYYYKVHYLLPKRLRKILKNTEEINSFSDQDAITRYFIMNKKYINLYEHGAINYKEKFNSINQKVKEIFFKMEKPYGRNEFVKNIYLRGSAPIPKDIMEKVKIINLEILWNNIKQKNKEIIVSIFGLNLESQKSLKEKEIILLTQPFSEIGTLTEREKIELYRKIIKKYNKEKLIIKGHPQEKTDYRKEFSDIMILENKFPSELLSLLGLNLKKVVTINSTAVAIFLNKVEIDFYSSRVHPKIFNSIGDDDYYMKTNCFLDEDDKEI